MGQDRGVTFGEASEAVQGVDIGGFPVSLGEKRREQREEGRERIRHEKGWERFRCNRRTSL